MIVARALALFPQPRGGQPDERMEPVDSAGGPRDQLNEEVVPLHVCELMEQHITPALSAPRVGFRGKQNRRPPNAPRHRHRRSVRLQETDVPGEAELEREILDQQQPPLVSQRRGGPIEPGDSGHPNR